MQKVIIVHALDTEGPLHESMDNQFDRIEDLFGIKNIKRTKSNFEKLLSNKIKLGNGLEKKISSIFQGHIAERIDDWSKIDNQCEIIYSKKFRNKYVDSFGNCWKFSWHCMDHINYDYNPRRRTLGYHNIYDYYKKYVDENKKFGDEIQWHFHPMSTYNDSHRCATSYFRTPEIFNILTRKIIERNFFPSAYRAGYQVERPDSNWFLEQWIPFDISNTSVENNKELDKYLDFKNGRSTNWRNAPNDWSIYNPSHDDYQEKGNCRRWIGRALNVLNRFANLTEKEVDKAFKKSIKENKTILLGVSGHDWRNLITEVDHIYNLIIKSSKKFNNAKFEFCTTSNGFRKTIWPNKKYFEKFNLKIKLNKKPKNDYPNILIENNSSQIFGPQPFFAIKTKSRNFLFDNLDFINKKKWAYAFRPDTLPIEDVESIGIAANDVYGQTFVKTIII